MKIIILIVFVLLVLLIAIMVGCNRRDAQQANSSNEVNIKDLQPGNIKHKLNESQMEKIKRIKQALAEVDRSPLDKWVDDFSRDENPDSEIAIWESIVNAYQQFCKNRGLNLDAKTEVFGILLMRSATAEDKVLESIKLKNLTIKDAKELLSLYKEAAKPIQVIKE